MSEETKTYKSSVTLSKVKYADLERSLRDKYDEELVEGFLQVMRETLQFDPSMSSYDTKRSQQIREYRARKKAEGVSTYVTSGMKQAYEKRKKNST